MEQHRPWRVDGVCKEDVNVLPCAPMLLRSLDTSMCSLIYRLINVEREAGGTLSPYRWSYLWCEPRVHMQRTTYHNKNHAQGVFSRWGWCLLKLTLYVSGVSRVPLGKKRSCPHRSASKLWGIETKGTRIKGTLAIPYFCWSLPFLVL